MCHILVLYQAVALTNLLTKYALVFSCYDTDLGHLKDVYHKVITIDDTLGKHQMRCTPFHFEKGNEEN